MGQWSPASTGPRLSSVVPVTLNKRPSVFRADGHAYRCARVVYVYATGQTLGRPQRQAAHPTVAHVLLHLQHQ